MSDDRATTAVEIRMMDEADCRQIVEADSAVKQALVYKPRDTRRPRQMTYAGVKYMMMLAAGKGAPMQIVDRSVRLLKHDPENKRMWRWCAEVVVRNKATGLETLGAAESGYVDDYEEDADRYDTFGMTKAYSKAERNALRKQISEADAVDFLRTIEEDKVQEVGPAPRNGQAPANGNARPAPQARQSPSSGDAAPSDAQLKYLKMFRDKKQYDGPTPATKGEMSGLLGRLKEAAA